MLGLFQAALSSFEALPGTSGILGLVSKMRGSLPPIGGGGGALSATEQKPPNAAQQIWECGLRAAVLSEWFCGETLPASLAAGLGGPSGGTICSPSKMSHNRVQSLYQVSLRPRTVVVGERPVHQHHHV